MRCVFCRLLEDVERIATSFMSQDFRCPRTRQVSIRFCASHSDLAVPLEMDFSVDDITDQMNVLHLVASSNGFKWLLQVIESMQIFGDKSE